MKWLHRLIDWQAEAVARWLYSRIAYVQLVYGTFLWVPLVVLGFDQHGFIYLYIATAMSLVTQSPLAMLAHKASRDAKEAEKLTEQALRNQTDMLNFLIHQFGEFKEEIEEIADDIETHHEQAS